jgi:large repetitive protein
MGEKTKTIAKTAVIALFLLTSAFVIFGMNTVSAASAPGTPTGLVATPGVNQVTLSWNAPTSDGGSAIDYYIVYQDGVELTEHYTGLTATVAIQYEYHGPMTYDPYKWTVAAHNAAGIGSQSDSAAAYPVGVPGAIRNFEVTPENGQVEIVCYNFGRPDDGGLSFVFVIYQDGQQIMQTSDEHVVITGLVNGHTYNFSAAMKNSAGTGPLSSMDVTPMTTPDAPTGLTATPLNKAVYLTWSAPANNGGGLNQYIVYQNGVQIKTTTDTAITIDNLNNGATYSFTVAAQNNAGTGPQSSGASATPRPDVANRPTGLTETPADGQVTLSWTIPDSDGGATIDYYVIYQDDVALTINPTANSAIISGLVNGQSYSFAVAAHNSVGIGAKSDAVQAVPYTLPSITLGLDAVAGNGQVILNWTAPASNGGAGIDYYIVYQDGAALPNQQTGTTATISGLVNGQTYAFTVAAHNSAGLGPQSITKTSIPVAVPDAPTGLTAVPGNAKVTLNWTAPLNNGGNQIDYYAVYQNGADVQHVTGLSVTINGLTYGNSYDFAVASHSEAGTGPKSVTVTASPKPALTSPGSPPGLTATSGNGRIDLSWSPLVDDGGAAVDYYLVYQNDVVVGDVTGTSFSITGLQNGQSYSFAVAAHNAIGTGVKSNAITATPYTTPSIPIGLTAVPGNAKVTLTWAAPSDNGGAAIDHYVIYQDGVALTNDPTGLTTVINGLTNGQSYNFTVAAHNLAGAGPVAYINAIPVRTVPSEPLNVVASTIDSGIVLVWTAPGDNGGYPITYSVFRGTSAGTETLLANLSDTSYTDRDIVLGTNYYYYIEAVNQLGGSLPSKEVGPIYASTAVILNMDTVSSSTIGDLMTVTGSVVKANGGAPIEGLSINLAYSVNNGQSWREMPSVKTSVNGNFTSQWIPTATGIYMLKGTWSGNAIYQAATSIKSLAITLSPEKYVFTVQSNSTITDLSFNSNSKELKFNVSGESGTSGYSRIVISKELVVNGSEIKLLLDGKAMSYQLTSTNSSWILYFEYHHSTHSIVASLEGGSADTNNPDNSPLPWVAIAGLAVVSVLLVAGLVLFNSRRARK